MFQYGISENILFVICKNAEWKMITLLVEDNKFGTSQDRKYHIVYKNKNFLIIHIF